MSVPAGPARRGLSVHERLYVLIVLVAMQWLLTPEHQRRLWLMRAADQTRRVMATLACRTGRLAIAHEADCGARAYLLPYACSRARDGAGAVYERLREAP